jgi:NAD(P)-dependent dehydrogenase (short-subunit alcohol dehydrogenase family)
VTTEDDLRSALKVLGDIAEDRGLLARISQEERVALQKLAGQIAAPDIAQRRKLVRALRKKKKRDRADRDNAARQGTGIREMRAQPVFAAPPEHPQLGAGDVEDDAQHLEDERKCYVCKSSYTRLHSFYDQLCHDCGELNYGKRTPRYDLSGRTALVTGARVKIGYYAALMLLRNGCHVVVTTRFPRDAAARYAKEPDFADFQDRLDIFGLDLRHTPSVQQLADHMTQTADGLDFVIHNACQTVRRPPGFYGHLVEHEDRPVAELAAPERRLVERYDDYRAEQRALSPAQMSQQEADADLLLPDAGASLVEIFPEGALDADLQQIDLRTHNSWRLTLGEVPTLELLEVLLVNAVAPFVLSARLKPLMTKRPSTDKHIVNVSAMEGQFYRKHKTDKHPHTNMAKAALNMLTRTSAQDYVQDGIHMNSVDTGWVTDEDPAHLAARKVEEHRFSPPLDVVDGAARIVDPIFVGLQTGEHPWGQFFKDYAPAPW